MLFSTMQKKMVKIKSATTVSIELFNPFPLNIQYISTAKKA